MAGSRTERAKTAIVFRSGDHAQAAIASVAASVSPAGTQERLQFTGRVEFDSATRGHIQEVILPLSDRILERLGVAWPSYNVSLANLSFASAAEIPLHLAGFSADTSVFLAMLSAALGISLSDGIVSTGHIAGPCGDIVLVRGIPAKLEAAASDPAVEFFIHPALDADSSLGSFSPRQLAETQDAISRWKGELRLRSVRDVAELVEAACDPEAIVLASLRSGFFERPMANAAADDPAGRAARFLTEGNETRFWSALEDCLFNKRDIRAKALLLARSRYHALAKSYPKEFGLQLLSLVSSLPPSLLRRKRLFPLLPMSECIALSQFADEGDHGDVRLLQDATQGDRIGTRRKAPATSTGHDKRAPEAGLDAAEQTLDWVLSQMDEETMAFEIGVPIDAARMSFLCQSATVESDTEFFDAVEAFYLHLLRHLGEVPANATSPALADESHDLLRRSFVREGGMEAALANARVGVNGGMRHVFDGLTEQFKRERSEKRINRVLKESMDPMAWEAKVAFAQRFLKRIEPNLPPDLRGEKAEQCAHHYEDLVRAYVSSMEQLKSLLRRL
ncbi:MAG: hypothetical protein NTW86_15580 [Candidatus Sumerlaeota bacterium]|nr:hypothetical protein [Candidatus Sumerlaeota bacterium]